MGCRQLAFRLTLVAAPCMALATPALAQLIPPSVSYGTYKQPLYRAPAQPRQSDEPLPSIAPPQLDTPQQSGSSGSGSSANQPFDPARSFLGGISSASEDKSGIPENDDLSSLSPKPQDDTTQDTMSMPSTTGDATSSTSDDTTRPVRETDDSTTTSATTHQDTTSGFTTGNDTLSSRRADDRDEQ